MQLRRIHTFPWQFLVVNLISNRHTGKIEVDHFVSSLTFNVDFMILELLQK